MNRFVAILLICLSTNTFAGSIDHDCEEINRKAFNQSLTDASNEWDVQLKSQGLEKMCWTWDNGQDGNCCAVSASTYQQIRNGRVSFNSKRHCLRSNRRYNVDYPRIRIAPRLNCVRE